MTSNGEREFPAAFLRRCLRLDIEPPGLNQLAAIVEAQLGPEVMQAAGDLIRLFSQRSQEGDLATDQLLNAIQLTCHNNLEPEERSELVDLLLRYLSSERLRAPVNTVKEFLARLTESGEDLTEREVAEALWLAVHMTGAGDGQQQSTWPHDGILPADFVDMASVTANGVPSPGDGTRLSHRDLTTDGTMPVGRDALPLRLAGPRDIHQTLDLQRALRSLARTISAGPATILDEDTTVAHSAQAGTMIPVLTRSAQRWLNLALIVDTSPSMILWDNLVSELHALLTQLGAFRTVRIWDFRFGGTAAISPRGSAGTLRNPCEIVDPTGRQAILVITDCAGEAWLSGTAMRAVDAWAHTGPLAIVQPLSQRLWPRSGVQCHHVQLRSPYPGAPNNRLVVDSADWYLDDESRAGIPVPVLEASSSWFSSWSRLVSNGGPAHAMVTFTGASATGVRIGDTSPPGSPGDTDPKRIVERFMAGASQTRSSWPGSSQPHHWLSP